MFDWVVRQIQLVPAGGLAAPGLGQAEARPFDVLVRGMATEGENGWSERGWVFMSLCRQLGLDSGLVTYTPLGAKSPAVWCVAVLVDGTPYLFDPRLGLPIPGPGGDGVATLDEAMTDPAVLDRMDLNVADQPAYVTRGALLASPTRVGVLLDSSTHYFCPRMKLLQQRLAGKDVTILYRDPAEQRDTFNQALGRWAGKVTLWELPVRVETLLFQSPRFVQSTQAALELFRPELPLVYARMKHLRGETARRGPVLRRDPVRREPDAPDPPEGPDPRRGPEGARRVRDVLPGDVPPRPEARQAGRVLLREDAGDAPRARPPPPLFQHVPLGRPGEPRPAPRGRRGPRPRPSPITRRKTPPPSATATCSAPATSSGSTRPPPSPHPSRRHPPRPGGAGSDACRAMT